MHFFSLSIFSATSASLSEAEGLYQLGVPRCPPQSSIEGLEDIEVVFWFYGGVHECLFFIYCISEQYLQELLFPSAVCPCYYFTLSFSQSPCEPHHHHPYRENAKHTCCCWWCTGAISWTRPAGTRVQRAATWPPWPPCWRRWRGPTLRRPANMWWSNWYHVRLCAPKPSPWCPSECNRRGGQSRWLYSHMKLRADGLKFINLDEDINCL